MNHPTVRHLWIENERLRGENERLRGKLQIRDGRHEKRITRAYAAALALAELHIAYLPTTRDQAQACGLTQRQFENGIALLRMARVVEGRRWMLHDLAGIDARLRVARGKALDCPESFRAWLPAHALR